MRINQNISAMNTHASMIKSDNSISKSLERLSSGLRINRAADDAAGLAISEKMRGQIRGLQQASRNAQDGISMLQTAEGALNETHSILQRMRELSVQAANDTLTGSDRAEIQKEMDQLTKEVDRIAGSTEFNTKKLLRGMAGAVTLSGANLAGGLGAVAAVVAAPVVGTDGNDAVASTGTITISGVVQTDTITIEGTTYTFAADNTGNNIDISGAATDDDIATALAAKLAADGNVSVTNTTNNVLTIEAQVAGTAGDNIDISQTGAHIAFNGGGGGATTLQGGADATFSQVDLDFSALTNFFSGQTVSIAGTTYTAGDGTGGTFAIGGNLAASLGNLGALVNAGAYTTSVQGGDTLRLTADAAGTGTSGTVNLGYSGRVAVAASGTLQLTSNLQAGDTVGIGGTTLTAGTDFTVGATIADTLNSLQGAIDGLAAVTATDDSTDTITITAAATGTGGNAIAISTSSVTSATLSLTMHIGANAGQSMVVSLSNMDAGSLAIGRDSLGVAVAAGTNADQGLDVSTQAAANSAITVLDTALSTVSSERSRLGAFQNRLEHTISNLGAASENLSSSESRIRDVDMAEEMANFSRSQILMQASTAMMAQANQKPQAVLKLLG